MISEKEIRPASGWRSWRSILVNPVMIKELRGRMRGRRAFIVLTIYVALMSGFIGLVYLAIAATSNDPFGSSNRQAGKVVFGGVLSVQVFLVVFIGPAFTSAAISGEKERQTYDLLRTTLLSARSLVIGKLLSALSYVFLLIVAAIPLQSIAFLLGGISLVELLVAQMLVATSAVTFALLGLFFSTLLRTSIASSVSTYAAALTLTIGSPIIAGFTFSILGPLLFSPSAPGWPLEAILVYIGLGLAATNLPATIIVSALFLQEQGSLFFFSEIIDGHSIYLFSPWWVYIAFYLLLALILFWTSVSRIRRIAIR